MILDYETYWNPEGGGNLGRLIELFDEAGPDYRAVLFPPSRDVHPRNRGIDEALAAFPDRDRFIPCAYINPNLYDAVDELETAVESGKVSASAVEEVYSNTVPGIARLLIRDFVLAFEVASVLLLAAIIGALALIRER